MDALISIRFDRIHFAGDIAAAAGMGYNPSNENSALFFIHCTNSLALPSELLLQRC